MLRNSTNNSISHILCRQSTYKSLNHRVNCCKFNLCRDIEKNPGPTFVDASKTIHAPYSQDFIVFGENAGQQCISMSLCALLYKYTKGAIECSLDLVTVMDMGNDEASDNGMQHQHGSLRSRRFASNITSQC